jgi:hypothetical protein
MMRQSEARARRSLGMDGVVGWSGVEQGARWQHRAGAWSQRLGPRGRLQLSDKQGQAGAALWSEEEDTIFKKKIGLTSRSYVHVNKSIGSFMSVSMSTRLKCQFSAHCKNRPKCREIL